MASYESSDEENEDFSPVIPSAAIAASAATAAATATAPTSALDDTDVTSPVLKKEKKDDSGSRCTATATIDSATAASAIDSLQRAQDAPEVMWERYRRQQLPSAPLYERSFLHTSLQDAHDALSTSSHNTSSPMEAQAIHDVCVHLDPLGALIATVDSVGAVRIWRKLPRGLFLITELDKVFPPIPGATSGHGQLTRHHYWAHAYTALQTLVFVRVEEEWEMNLDSHVHRTEVDHNNPISLTSKVRAPLGTVRVHVRQVNPVTLTVEERDTLTFQVPVQRVVSAAAAAVESTPHGHNGGWKRLQNNSSMQADACLTLQTSLAYTRRPFFLTHQYAPHIAFFVTLPPSPTASGLTSGGNGVVLCPCFAPAMSMDRRSCHGAGGARNCTPTRLSVANIIVACAQQGSGLERNGSSACVLVDAAGVVDYCTIEPAIGSPEATTAGGLTLKVIAGLAAVPPMSHEARVWRQWIRFDRRQRTGFFSLVQDCQQALKTLKESEVAATADKPPVTHTAADVQVLPAAVQLTSDGRYVIVWSFRCLRVAARSNEPVSRIPSTQRCYDVTLELCLHLLDFGTGLCIGRHTEPIGVFATSEDVTLRDSEWARYLKARSNLLSLHLHVEPSSAAKNQFYIMLPEVPWEQLLGVGTVSRDALKATTTPVVGRVVYVYEVTLETAASSTRNEQVFATVRRTPHQPGEWEAIVRRGEDRLWQESHHSGHEASRAQCGASLATTDPLLGVLYLRSPNECTTTPQNGNHTHDDTHAHGRLDAVRHAGLEVCRAPLLLLRRAVTASQDLKNLVAASPVGAALGADARKHLFVAPTMNDSSFGAASGETLLLSSSVDVSSTALLVYSSESPWGSAAVGRILSEATTSETEEGSTEEVLRHQQQLKKEYWVKALRDLHRSRDDACGTLLLATVAPQCSSTVPVPENRTEASTTDPTDTADQANGGDGSRDEGQPEKKLESSATTVSRATAAKRATPVTDAAAEVRILLKDVLPTLDASSPPVALVHVRGYGPIRLHLLPHIAPLATESFLRLARRHYYDRLTFHRIIPAAIVQGGCPRGDGTGGESAFANGAPFADEGLTLFPFFSHTANPLCCWLCMANAGPNTNGSQFFFTVPGGEEMSWLNARHTVFGYAVEGLDVVRAMSMAARDSEDRPLSPIIIERVDVLPV